MKYVYLILNWVFGVFFFSAGMFSLVESPLAGLCLIAAAALLLPPVRGFVYSKTNKVLSTEARVISIFVLFIAFEIFVGQAQDKKAQELVTYQAHDKAEKATQLRQENIDHFNANREQIISAINKALSEKDYRSVISQSNKYLVSGDKELEQMNAQAKKELDAIEKAKKTETLLAELKSVPGQEYERNKNLYQQLLSMYPDNELYKTKVAFYTGKEKKEDAERFKSQSLAKSDAETAGLKLAVLAQKGYISMQLDEPSTFMLVEPTAWVSMMHQDKIDMCRLGLIFTQGYKKETGKKIDYLILWDMTTHDTIARAYLDDNRIEILK